MLDSKRAHHATLRLRTLKDTFDNNEQYKDDYNYLSMLDRIDMTRAIVDMLIVSAEDERYNCYTHTIIDHLGPIDNLDVKQHVAYYKLFYKD